MHVLLDNIIGIFLQTEPFFERVNNKNLHQKNKLCRYETTSSWFLFPLQTFSTKVHWLKSAKWGIICRMKILQRVMSKPCFLKKFNLNYNSK